VNALRLWQVWRKVGVQPFDGAYLRLAIPALGCAAAAIAARAAAGGREWWLVLGVTVVAGLAAYLALLPAGLTVPERAQIGRLLRRA
jgi:hypothetical protein